MKQIAEGSRIFLGFFFTMFGLNGLVMITTGSGFIPMPAPPEELANIMGGLFGAIYLMPLVMLVQLISGVLLLSGKYTSLALILIAPVLFNILMIHVVADMSGIILGLIAAIAWGMLFQSKFQTLKPIFQK